MDEEVDEMNKKESHTTRPDTIQHIIKTFNSPNVPTFVSKIEWAGKVYSCRAYRLNPSVGKQIIRIDIREDE